MTQFLELIKQARIDVLGDDPFWDDVEKCRPLVFHCIPINDIDARISMPLEKCQVDAPFPVFSVERTDKDGFSKSIFMAKNVDGTYSRIGCLFVKEISPKKYAACGLAIVSGDDGQTFFKKRIESFSDAQIGYALNKLFNGVSSARFGSQSVRQTVKIGRGPSKRIHRINTVIHVSPKKILTSIGAGIPINWSHRFDVRGHWRDLPGGIGKDRGGDYNVENYTWVSHYVKGPEGLPLIKKTRVVTGDDRAGS